MREDLKLIALTSDKIYFWKLTRTREDTENPPSALKSLRQQLDNYLIQRYLASSSPAPLINLLHERARDSQGESNLFLIRDRLAIRGNRTASIDNPLYRSLVHYVRLNERLFHCHR